MSLLDRYETILRQATAEAGPATATGARGQSEAAARLGDVLYRLCLEHAVPFNAFRDSVMTALAGSRPMMVGKAPGRREPFAGALKKDHPLILLALELMPPDPEF